MTTAGLGKAGRYRRDVSQLCFSADANICRTCPCPRSARRRSARAPACASRQSFPPPAGMTASSRRMAPSCVSVDHEPAVVEGINPSPWFAFRVNSDTAREAAITLDYTDYTHRYAPWIKRGGAAWEKLPETSVALNERKTRATLKLPLSQGETYVAAPADLARRRQYRLDAQRAVRPRLQRDEVRRLARRPRSCRVCRRRRHRGDRRPHAPAPARDHRPGSLSRLCRAPDEAR